MVRLCLFVSAAAVSVVSLASVSDAHNFIYSPLTEFKSGTPGYGNWVDQFSPPWSGDVTTGASFTALAKKHGYATTRSFLENRGPDCGYSNPNAKAKAIPTSGLVMAAREMGHPGPCELWLDDKMVYHNDDCMVAYGTATPGFKVDFSSCKGSCMLRFYWLGLQNKGQLMQSYKNCIPLTGSSASTSSKRTSSTSTKTSTTTSAPKSSGTSSKLRSRSTDEYSFDDLDKNRD